MVFSPVHTITISDSNLKRLLHGVEKPGRYTGGEYGIIRREWDTQLRVAISYPDIYEIGMSNLSVRLIYGLLNSLDGVSCERVFAPGMDFEAELRAQRLPLYSLETHSSLRSFDILGFSVGYELTFTNILNILDLGGISLYNRDRSAGEPIVIAGGPAITNPLPFGAFIDAVFIGEIEGEAMGVFAELSAMKGRGASREDLLAWLTEKPYVWCVGKNKKARRVLWSGFGLQRSLPEKVRAQVAPFPVPNIRTVQDHGVVEIMRGCPNGCRFCHAGIFYRPFRLKEAAEILKETEDQVFACGYREITLSSLSSGDYPDIAGLVRSLNRHFQAHKVSFALPSLRINSIALDLLSELSSVRKSGLTFAVETPIEQWQRGVNKPAPLEKTVEILQEARAKGWRMAKFYFMVGLPVAEGADETESIAEFLTFVREKTGMTLTANVSAFIPKPHTAFQWARQLTEREALDRIMTAKRLLAGRGVKVRYHAPFLSLLEGVISRGDERAGDLVYQAFKAGARFDSWEDLVQWTTWRTVFQNASWDVEKETCRARALQEKLPWDSVTLGVAKSYLRQEHARAKRGELTDPCCANCAQVCGVCGKNIRVKDAVSPLSRQQPPLAVSIHSPGGAPASGQPPAGHRLLFAFTKQGMAAFLGHLDLMGIFERSIQRAGYQACFTAGFNPKPKLEFAQPLSLGIESLEEIALIVLAEIDTAEGFCRRLNGALPEGITLSTAKILPRKGTPKKPPSLMSQYWGADYLITDEMGNRLSLLAQAIRVPAPGDPRFIQILAADESTLVLRIGGNPEPARGCGNILRLMERAGFKEPLREGFRVVRRNTWAKGASGEAVAYFSLEL